MAGAAAVRGIATVTTSGVASATALAGRSANGTRSSASVVATKPTQPTATLGVYVTASNTFIGTLRNNGNGRFSASLAWPTNPDNITVRSNFGGFASGAVTLK